MKRIGRIIICLVAISAMLLAGSVTFADECAHESEEIYIPATETCCANGVVQCIHCGEIFARFYEHQLAYGYDSETNQIYEYCINEDPDDNPETTSKCEYRQDYGTPQEYWDDDTIDSADIRIIEPVPVTCTTDGVMGGVYVEGHRDEYCIGGDILYAEHDLDYDNAQEFPETDTDCEHVVYTCKTCHEEIVTYFHSFDSYYNYYYDSDENLLYSICSHCGDRSDLGTPQEYWDDDTISAEDIVSVEAVEQSCTEGKSAGVYVEGHEEEYYIGMEDTSAGHNLEPVESFEGGEDSCPGTVYKCSVCGEEITVYDHDLDSDYIYDSKTQMVYRHCPICGIDEEVGTIYDLFGDEVTEDDLVITERVEKTCTTDGATASVGLKDGSTIYGGDTIWACHSYDEENAIEYPETDTECLTYELVCEDCGHHETLCFHRYNDYYYDEERNIVYFECSHCGTHTEYDEDSLFWYDLGFTAENITTTPHIAETCTTDGVTASVTLSMDSWSSILGGYTIPAGHYYKNGKCVYCGDTIPATGDSADSLLWIIIAAAAVVLAAGAVIILRKKAER